MIRSSHSEQKEEKANSRNKEITHSKEDLGVWKVPWGKDNAIFLAIAIVKLVPLLNTTNELSSKARRKRKLILSHIQFGVSVGYANGKVQYIQVTISQPQHCWCLALGNSLCIVLSSIPGIHPLEASNTSPSRDKINCSRQFYVFWEEKNNNAPNLRTTGSRAWERSRSRRFVLRCLRDSWSARNRWHHRGKTEA